MSNITKNQLVVLINGNEGIVNFGSSEDAIENSWILKAEEHLGYPLSISYKWFLHKYSGGEVGGEEIYSIYGVDFETVNGGDIIYQHIIGLKNGTVKSTQLVVSETDFGEVYFFDATQDIDGEYPIYLWSSSGEHKLYANNFYEFLYKRVKAHI